MVLIILMELMSHTLGRWYSLHLTTFGETDATTGEWKIKVDTGLSQANYGTNGFFILKDSNSVTDQSGNSNNFTTMVH